MPLDMIFGRREPQQVFVPAPVINIPAPPTPDDPKVEEARLASVAARARAQGRDSTIFTDQTTERTDVPLRKPRLGA